MIKPVLSFSAVAAVALGLIGIGTPAFADPPALPTGDSLYTLPCAGDPITALSLDTTTGAGTPIGSGLSGEGCSYDPEWNPVTHIAYLVLEHPEEEVDDTYILSTIDLNTGVITPGPTITSDGTTPLEFGTLVIGLDGSAYMTLYNEVYSLSLATGIATDLGTLPDVTNFGAWGASVDPTTGEFYLLREDGALFRFNPLTLTTSLVGTFPFAVGTSDTYGFAIDHNGTAWVVTYLSQNEEQSDHPSELWSAPLDDFGTATKSGDLVNTATGLPYYSFTALIAYDIPAEPVAVLANTGVNIQTPALGAALAGLLGAALLVMARVRSRAKSTATAK